MEAIYSSDDEEQVINFKVISTTKMGNTSTKYSPDPCTILGNGLTAIVYPGWHFGINKPAAVKFIKKQYLRVENDQVNELKIWSEIDQDMNIVRLYDSYRDPRNGLFLAMEKAERTFRKQIKKCNPSRDDVITWLHQVSKAVEYLHGKGVIHRDIKPDNILMFEQDGNKIVAKLADFGVSKMISNLERTGTFSMASGTLLWMAPEALENKTRRFKNTKMLDIFALGMTFYFGLSKGGHPFCSQEDDVLDSLVLKMTGTSLSAKQLSFDQLAANDLLSKMMKRQPNDRANISDVLSHCLFWNWEKEQLFLIRVAICLSKPNCSEIDWIKGVIDESYMHYFSEVNAGKPFNWITMGIDYGFNIPELLFTTRKRKLPTTEYGWGDSVTKFLKLFRDKYVHHPEMNAEGVFEFSDTDGIFCDEVYVRKLTSTCPSVSAVLCQVLSAYADLYNLLSLRKLYFPRKLVGTSTGIGTNFENIQGRVSIFGEVYGRDDPLFPEIVQERNFEACIQKTLTKRTRGKEDDE